MIKTHLAVGQRKAKYSLSFCSVHCRKGGDWINNAGGVEHLDICYFARSVFSQPENILALPTCACSFMYRCQSLAVAAVNTFTPKHWLFIRLWRKCPESHKLVVFKGLQLFSLLNCGCGWAVTDNNPMKTPSSIPGNSCAGTRQLQRRWIYLRGYRGCFWKVHLLQQRWCTCSILS